MPYEPLPPARPGPHINPYRSRFFACKLRDSELIAIGEGSLVVRDLLRDMTEIEAREFRERRAPSMSTYHSDQTTTRINERWSVQPRDHLPLYLEENPVAGRPGTRWGPKSRRPEAALSAGVLMSLNELRAVARPSEPLSFSVQGVDLSGETSWLRVRSFLTESSVRPGFWVTTEFDELHIDEGLENVPLFHYETPL